MSVRPNSFILSELNPSQNLTARILKIRFNIILPATPKTTKNFSLCTRTLSRHSKQVSGLSYCLTSLKNKRHIVYRIRACVQKWGQNICYILVWIWLKIMDYLIVVIQCDSFGTRPKKMRISQRLFIRFWTCICDYIPCFMRSMSILVCRSLTSWSHRDNDWRLAPCRAQPCHCVVR